MCGIELKFKPRIVNIFFEALLKKKNQLFPTVLLSCLSSEVKVVGVLV